MAKSTIKAKQQKTLKRMKQTRYEDTLFLRNIIEAKLKWATEEKAKGLVVIEKQMQQLRENKEILYKLDAVISALTEILETKKEIHKD